MEIKQLIINILVYSIPIISIAYVIVGIRLFKKKINGQFNYFSLFMFASAVYSIGYFIELTHSSMTTFTLIRSFEYLGTVFIPCFGILFMLELVKIDIKQKIVILCVVISILLGLIFFTDPIHHFVYQKIQFIQVNSYTTLITKKGIGYFLILAYYMAFLTIAIVLLWKAYKKEKNIRKKKSYRFLFIIFQIPWVTIVLIILGYDQYIDLAPGTIMLVSILIGINEIKNDMFQLEISRWKNNFEKSDNSIILVSNEKEILAINERANNFEKTFQDCFKDVIRKNLKDIEKEDLIKYTKNDEQKWIEIKVNDFNEKQGLKNYYFIDVSKRKKVEEKIKESEEKFRLLITQMEQGIAVHKVILNDEDEVIDYYFIDANERYEELTGLKRKDIIGKKVLEILPKTNMYWIKKYGNVAMTGEAIDFEHYSERLNKYFEIVVYSPRYKEFALIISDISARKFLEVELSKEKKLLEITLKSIGDGVIATDNTGNITFINDTGEKLLKYVQKEVQGQFIGDIFKSINIETKMENKNIVLEVIKNGCNQKLEVPSLLIAKDQSVIPIEKITASMLIENEKLRGVLLIFRDYLEKKQKQDEIIYLNYHDYLTGLYNRRYFEEKLIQLDTPDNLPLTLIMGDVNGLKLVNDSFGHILGDELLKKVAQVLVSCVRNNDIVARLGGDEFIIIMPRTDIFQVVEIINDMKLAMSKEKVGPCELSISLGYEIKETIEENVQDIFKKAEDDMYRHKLYESVTIKNKTIDLIINTFYEGNDLERFHSKNVSEIAKEIANELGFDENGVEKIGTAGLLHDIGKIVVDQKVLNKKDDLTMDELKEIRRHPEIGYRILSSVNELSEIADIVLEHHERWDGKGYPKMLKGEEIAIEARILALAEAYDVMIYEQPYQKKLSKKEALNEIEKNLGSQFDPTIGKLFIKCMKK